MSSSWIIYVLILFGVVGLLVVVCFNCVYLYWFDDFLLVLIVVLLGCLLILFLCVLNIVMLFVYMLVWGGVIVCFGFVM